MVSFLSSQSCFPCFPSSLPSHGSHPVLRGLNGNGNARENHIFRIADETGELKLSRGSRVAASGEAGRLAIKLLLGELKVEESGGDERLAALNVRYLCPKLGVSLPFSDYDYANRQALADSRLDVLVIEECLEQKDKNWTSAFQAFLCNDALQAFNGAVLFCISNEAQSLAPLCHESWIIAGSRLHQEPYLEIIDDALNAPSAEDLLRQALAIDYCSLKFWVDDARDNGKEITLFAVIGPDGTKSLRGFVCHHLIPTTCEFHVSFIFVPKECRGLGLGGRLVRWIIGKAARIPKSQCRWVSLDAAHDALVEWYEKFGFMDMTCGPDDDGQTAMELANSSMVDTPAHARNKILTWSSVAESDDEEGQEPAICKKDSVRLSFALVDDGESTTAPPTPGSVKRTNSGISRLSVGVAEEADSSPSGSKRISIPRDLWSTVSEEL